MPDLLFWPHGKTKGGQATEAVTTDRPPKSFGPNFLAAGLNAGVGNIEALGLKTAAYAAVEVTRSLLTMRSFGSRASNPASSTAKRVAGHTS